MITLIYIIPDKASLQDLEGILLIFRLSSQLNVSKGCPLADQPCLLWIHCYPERRVANLSVWNKHKQKCLPPRIEATYVMAIQTPAERTSS